MCGITAVLSRRVPIDPPIMPVGLASLHHRGPDGKQYWMADDRLTALGHTRLSIIDLTTGDQPISNEDRTIHIVVNGEFYDFERSRAELEARGHRFRTRSDSEIALHLYEGPWPHPRTSIEVRNAGQPGLRGSLPRLGSERVGDPAPPVLGLRYWEFHL